MITDAHATSEHLDLVTIGETMALLTPADGARLTADTYLAVRAGGAESNVAALAAQLGLRTCWISSLGADPLGDIVLAEIANHGVDVSQVRRDHNRPTGVYFKDPTPQRTTIHYYRAGSAASAMEPDILKDVDVDASIWHLTGVTAALSQGCAELVEGIVGPDRPNRAAISFDVNYRPSLWSHHPGDLLRDIAQRCDIVFVGLDEAADLWGTTSAASIRAILHRPRHLIIKDGSVDAVSFDGTDITCQPALPVQVVDVVGAGDAFAAGWLAGHLRQLPPSDKLRLGHWVASQVLQSPSDLVALPNPASIMSLPAEDIAR